MERSLLFSSTFACTLFLVWTRLKWYFWSNQKLLFETTRMFDQTRLCAVWTSRNNCSARWMSRSTSTSRSPITFFRLRFNKIFSKIAHLSERVILKNKHVQDLPVSDPEKSNFLACLFTNLLEKSPDSVSWMKIIFRFSQFLVSQDLFRCSSWPCRTCWPATRSPCPQANLSSAANSFCATSLTASNSLLSSIRNSTS